MISHLSANCAKFKPTPADDGGFVVLALVEVKNPGVGGKKVMWVGDGSYDNPLRVATPDIEVVQPGEVEGQGGLGMLLGSGVTSNVGSGAATVGSGESLGVMDSEDEAVAGAEPAQSGYVVDPGQGLYYFSSGEASSADEGDDGMTVVGEQGSLTHWFGECSLSPTPHVAIPPRLPVSIVRVGSKAAMSLAQCCCLLLRWA